MDGLETGQATAVDPVSMLDRARCLDLLASVGTGRLVCTVSCLPYAAPVSLSVEPDGELRLRMRREPHLELAADGAVVSIQSDRYGPDVAEGWTVVVTGEARLVPSTVPGCTELRVAPTLVSGRSLAWTPVP
jgi:nitroimidazol reductase NimA-like FMN-containing flavoprotein (pyridoxamine 5'-phosphate oxidase superfamily)